MKKPIRFVLKQYNVGILPGALYDQYTGVAAYFSLISFALLAPTAYHTTLRDPLTAIFPGMTFWVFASFFIILIFVLAILRWKIVLPSQMAYLNYMKYKHQDWIRRDISRLAAQLDRIEDKIGGDK